MPAAAATALPNADEAAVMRAYQEASRALAEQLAIMVEKRAALRVAKRKMASVAMRRGSAWVRNQLKKPIPEAAPGGSAPPRGPALRPAVAQRGRPIVYVGCAQCARLDRGEKGGHGHTCTPAEKALAAARRPAKLAKLERAGVLPRRRRRGVVKTKGKTTRP